MSDSKEERLERVVISALIVVTEAAADYLRKDDPEQAEIFHMPFRVAVRDYILNGEDDD